LRRSLSDAPSNRLQVIESIATKPDAGGPLVEILKEQVELIKREVIL
jgi:hypothetical protein